MRIHSETAWNIAALYSHYLASETRDLAAHIDVALNELKDQLNIDTANKRIVALELELDKLKNLNYECPRCFDTVEVRQLKPKGI